MKSRLKIFYSKGGFTELEEMINTWLEENEVDVINAHYTDNNAYASCLLFYSLPLIQRAKKERILKFATGDIAPEGAKYLATVKNGVMNDESRPDDYQYVWHYFLVEVEDE